MTSFFVPSPRRRLLLFLSMSSFHPPSLLRPRAMEDADALLADCIVISCCCECLIIQIVAYLFINLPVRMARKTRKYAKKKLQRCRRKKRGRTDPDRMSSQRDQCWYFDCDSLVGIDGGSLSLFQLDLDALSLKSTEEGCVGRGQNCMEEVEKVLEELSLKGEFAFGSFWGRRGDTECSSSRHCLGAVEGCYLQHDSIRVISCT